MQRAMAAALGCLVLAGCASRASDIKASYVSTLGYENLTCAQLADEAQVVSARAAEAAGDQDQRANRDAVAATVGVVVFWPALFLMRGNGENAAEVAQLRGEMETIEKVSRWKNCQIQFQTRADRHPAPPPSG